MAPRRNSFASSLPPIFDGTAFCFTPTPHTTRYRQLRPKLSLPSPISLPPPRGPLRTHVKKSFSRQFPSPLGLDLAPPLTGNIEESHSRTSSSDDELEEIYASSPIEQYTSPESVTSSSCTSRSNSPGPTLSTKVPSPPTVLYSKPPVLRESPIAGLYFVKPLIVGVKVTSGHSKSSGSKVERGQQVNHCKRTSTPVPKTSTTRGRRSSHP
ncbi:hypothetical protein EV426DRAFT_704927 [Tirmania nivea]|nr:hypothetical protein EV426DRAFT_704927 [Tirmania nivea]